MPPPLFAAVLLALLAAAASAQPSTAPDDTRRPPLFVVEGAQGRVYLLGSLHLLPPSALPLPPSVERAYAEASLLAFEIDLDAARSGAMALVEAATNDTLVADALLPDQKAAFDAYARASGVPAGALDTFEPWMASMTLGAAALARSGLTGEGVDAHLFARAKADGKGRIAFETATQQAAYLDDLPTAEQVAMLMAGLEGGPERTAREVEQMLDLWSRGEDEALADLMVESLAATPAARDALLTRRNAAWVPQIEALIESGETALVVVGAGHLVGEGSVPALLRARGHRVARL
jgi:uncharacterized protein YbaP (TraB family)